MIREIVTDPILLSRLSREATAEDLAIAIDLKDTLIAHADHCAGMAANMIGQSVRIIAVFVADQPLVLINPQIIKAEGKNIRQRKAVYHCRERAGRSALKSCSCVIRMNKAGSSGGRSTGSQRR